MKRILFLLCLSGMSLTGAYAETTYDLLSYLRSNANTYEAWACNVTDTEGSDPSIEFTDQWGDSGGWADWNSDINIKGYDQIVVNYTVVSGSTTVTLNLYSYYNENGLSVSSDSSSDGTITYDLTSLASEDIDLEHIQQFTFSGSSPSTITIQSIELVGGLPYSSSYPIVIDEAGNEYLNVAWGETTNWGPQNNTDEIGVSYDGISATLTFNEDGDDSEIWGGLGWSFYDYTKDSKKQYLNLSGYKQIVVTYSVAGDGEAPEDEGGNPGNQEGQQGQGGSSKRLAPGEDGPDATSNIYLAIEDCTDNNVTGDIQGSHGTITCDLTSDDYKNIDFSKVAAIVIKTSGTYTVNIESIQLVSQDASESSIEYIHEETASDGTHHYLNLGVTQANTWVGEMTTSEDESSNTTAAKATFKYTQQNMGWRYDANDNYLSISPETYAQVVVHYTITSTEPRTDEKISVMCELSDNSGNNIEAFDDYSIGQIRVNTSDFEAHDLTDITRVTFMVDGVSDDYTATVNIESIELLTTAQVTAAEGQTRNLLASQLSTWADLEDTYITPSDDNDTSCTITAGTNWTAASWWAGGISEEEYWGVKVRLKCATSCVVRLSIEYLVDDAANDNKYVESFTAISTGTDKEQTLILPFFRNKSTDYNMNYSEYESPVKKVNEIYLIWGQIESGPATIEILSAELLARNTYGDDFLTITTNSLEGYGTYYNSQKAYYMPYGLKGTTITNISDIEKEDDATKYAITTSWGYKYDQNESPTFTGTGDTFTGGDIVPAGTPLLVQGSADENTVLTYTAFIVGKEHESDITDEIKEKGNGNLLHGQDSKTTAAEMGTITASDTEGDKDDYYYYKLTYKEVDEDGHWVAGTAGFYWGAEEGVPFAMNNYNRAWLAIPKEKFPTDDDEDNVNGLKISGFSTEDENGDSTTGIAIVPVGDARSVSGVAIYNIQGVRVGDMSQKGVYIVSGKKIVKR